MPLGSTLRANYCIQASFHTVAKTPGFSEIQQTLPVTEYSAIDY
jgi:hypothetical protein